MFEARGMARLGLQLRRRHVEGNIYDSRVRDRQQERARGLRKRRESANAFRKTAPIGFSSDAAATARYIMFAEAIFLTGRSYSRNLHSPAFRNPARGPPPAGETFFKMISVQ